MAQIPYTPCEELGYTVGDKFELVRKYWCGFKKGDIITLYRDDGSSAPLFSGHNIEYSLCDGNSGAHVGLKDVKKIDENK